jgi:hypothetical protein
MSASRGAKPPDDVRKLLGLTPDSSPVDLEGAYWRLRAHIEARADAAQEPEFIAARRAELEELDRLVGRSVRPAARPSGPESSRPGARRLWLGIWGLVSTLAALVLALLLWRGSVSEEEPPMPPGPTWLSARAEPSGAGLEILAAQDERVIASGPADGTRYLVEPGDYRLRVARADCPDEWAQDVRVGPGESGEFAPRICQGSGSLVVRSNVSGDRVRIDGLDVGSTGETSHPVSVGDHDVAVEKSGFQPWTGTVRIHPDELLTLRAELEPAAGSAAKPGLAARSRSTPQSVTPRAKAAESAQQVAISPPRGGAPEVEARGSGSPLGRGSGSRRGPPGGSKGWHDDVKERLLSMYDHNKSKTLDTPGEIDAVPCSEWQAIEASYETGGLGIPMTRLYGFDGSDAPANTLGITRGMGSYAYNRMRRCGLR